MTERGVEEASRCSLKKLPGYLISKLDKTFLSLHTMHIPLESFSEAIRDVAPAAMIMISVFPLMTTSSAAANNKGFVNTDGHFVRFLLCSSPKNSRRKYN